MIRTRFAPSPTGYLHIGGVRTALFSWAYARKNKGVFVLRIEDTDLERSTPESVKAILDGMHWVGLDYDEGPFYQTHRFDRYKDVIQQLLASGHAYLCYCSKDELEAMRAEQEARGEKPRYDRRWRPEAGKTLPAIPADVAPVVRFKTPLDGVVAWDDAVKGRIEIANQELDDLIIARPDGSPTYNFCVVVDDWDMQITHVIRGDDHVNNTPRQINILKALNAPLPVYGHLPMILNEDGQKMSKRRDAVSVVDYADKGILPEALLNYLARLGWGHGDDEFFSMEQFVEWFSLEAVSASASRFNHEKFMWLNAQHIKTADNGRLAELIAPRLAAAGVELSGGPAIEDVIALVKERVQDLNALALEVDYFYRKREAAAADVDKHLSGDSVARMGRFADKLASLDTWSAEAIHELFKPFCAEEGIKMGQLGMPLRVLVCGTTQTPSVDAVLALIGKDEVLRRLRG
ncbi:MULTISPECIES: glutamate--tRNA ligase [Chromobacterium]|uniref:Glutamate--tRNA ligase n=1 Tax=Chromobacterium rhizoryzae TaxID=1778675 RepID=A0AAD0RRJ8_9NEIS|nr:MULTISPECIES: glutamate--tRNA ligase [Chromobacterium]AXT47061.1 glutamate--tRNA ligase [Chromobacterium rhizoryzae]MDH0342719.1 glutamate--tRNA ligase [Chromobacterium haemolyticum]OQS36715.1 glutamate--tRNA ligase [Chromobacterium haemolyticum]PTU70891.1 glutamate--tRNA ligase [Chromobacterium haemolyticum]QOD80885.1 glutamate--tRNA ligase [Chromobacterium haemolyticum]